LRASARVRTSRRPLAVEQTLVVGKGTVALVSVDGERVLVGVTQGCISFQPVGRSGNRISPAGGATE
jgi:flagellar biogenesis protein FliO